MTISLTFRSTTGHLQAYSRGGALGIVVVPQEPQRGGLQVFAVAQGTCKVIQAGLRDPSGVKAAGSRRFNL